MSDNILRGAATIMLRPLIRWALTIITVIVTAFVLNFVRNWIPDIPAVVWMAALVLVLGMRIYGQVEEIAHPVSEKLKSLEEQ